MILLKNLSQLEIGHLLKKGGMLLYSLNWEKYKQPGYADRFLIVKTRKQNHSINYRVTTINVRTGNKGDKQTTHIWGNRDCWAYIAPKVTNVNKCKDGKKSREMA